MPRADGESALSSRRDIVASQDSRESLEEVEQERVHLVGTFLLDPVAAIRDDVGSGVGGQPLRLVFDRVAEPEPSAVALAGDEDGGLARVLQGGEVLPSRR